MHHNKGTKVDFARAVSDERIRVIDGIHFFDAHSPEPRLLTAPALQIDPHKQHMMGPDGAENEVVDPESEGEVFSVEEG